MKIKHLSIKQASAKHLPKMILLSSLIFLLSLGAILQPPTSSFSQNETKMSQTKLIPKVAILTFDDNWKSQFTNARPALDKYGFKATFFIICNYVGRDNSTRMNWQDVLNLQKEGHDIESHTMNHKNLNKLSASKLDYEVGQSKTCLHNHGVVNSTIIATPYNEGWNNATVTNSIAKYYDIARSGNADIMFLHCNRWVSSQQDCRTYFSNGTLTYANRYSIRAWSHNFYDNLYSHNQTSIFNKFIQVVNKQSRYNVEGSVDAIPIIEYHNIDNQNTPYTTSIGLFTAEMKYLHDNGFTVLPMSAVGYNDTSKFLYLRMH
jgi:peptidoglycan/xylan/chitin deacetylase (PgdA/CDA1 family)